MSYCDSEGKRRSRRSAGLDTISLSNPDPDISNDNHTNIPTNANDNADKLPIVDSSKAPTTMMTPTHSNTLITKSTLKTEDRSMIDNDLSYGSIETDPCDPKTFEAKRYIQDDPPEEEEEIFQDELIAKEELLEINERLDDYNDRFMAIERAMTKQVQVLAKQHQENLVEQRNQLKHINKILTEKIECFANLWQQEFQRLEDSLQESLEYNKLDDEKKKEKGSPMDPDSEEDHHNTVTTKSSSTESSNDPPVDYVCPGITRSYTNTDSSEEEILTKVRPPDPPEEEHQVPVKKSLNYKDIPIVQGVRVMRDIDKETQDKFQDPNGTLVEPGTVIQEASADVEFDHHFEAGRHSIPMERATGVNVVYANKERKLTLPKYLKHYRFEQWKDLCILACDNNNQFPTITLTTHAGELEFNPLMELSEARALFSATVSALEKHAQEVLTKEDTRRANGLSLWTKLERHFLKCNNSALLHKKMKDDLAAITKNPTKTFYSYASRFQEKLDVLHRNGIPAPSHTEQVLQLLQGIKAKDVFSQTILQLDNSTWHVGMTPNQVVEWAKLEIEKYQTVFPHAEVFHKNKKSKEEQSKNNNKNTNNNKTSHNQQTVTTNDKDTITVSNKLQRRLNNTKNVVADLYALYGQNMNSCPIHNGANHSLLVCTQFSKICSMCGVTKSLKQVQKQLNLEDDGNRNSNDQQHSNNNKDSAKKQDTSPKSKANARLAKYAESIDDLFDENPQEYYEDLDEEDNQDNENNEQSNDYLEVSNSPIISNSKCNDENTQSFPAIARTTINTTTAIPLPHQLKGIFRAVVDSGASNTLSPFKELFEEITYFTEEEAEAHKVLMGDEKTEIKICGYGPMKYNMHGKTIRQIGLFVPEMGNTMLISVLQHIKTKGCTFIAEANETVLTFPQFLIYPRLHEGEIEVLLRPASENDVVDFDEYTAEKVQIHSHPSAEQEFKNITTDKEFKLINREKAKYLPIPNLKQYTETVKIKKLIPSAIIPTRATAGSIGFDIHSISNFTLEPGQIHKAPTGLATEIPDGMYGRIAPRSSLASKHITVEGGVVDGDYRGEIKVLLKNNGTVPMSFTTNDKIAQIIFEQASIPCIEVTNELSPTTRKGGFGSTNTTSAKTKSTICTQKSFRVSADHVLVLNKKRRNKPPVRRMAIPRITLEPEEELISTQPMPDKDPPERRKSPHQLEELEILHHRLDARPKTPVDQVLAMRKEIMPQEEDTVQNMRKELITNQSNTEQQQSTSSNASTLRLLSADRINSSQSKMSTISREILSQSIGFRHPEPLIKHIENISTGSVKIQNIPKNPHLDPGEAATMKSKPRNKTPSKRPQHFGEVMHMDIGFGPCHAIGGITYTLMVVDKATRLKFVYGLKNLKSSLHEAIQQLIVDCNGKIKQLRTDFDKKLIMGKTKKILLNEKIDVKASPPYRQHQNGLVERHWQTVVSMARNWLKSALLPSKYWYFAIKRACEITNILPIKLNNKITTPHELVYKKKVDYRVLFPMFSAAYIKYMKDEDEEYQVDPINKKWASDSLKCIVVGSCPHSDGLLFYHPPSKKTFSCADGYKFDTFAPAGSHFNEKYDGRFIFNLKSEAGITHIKPAHEKNTTVYFKQQDTNTYVPATILTQPVDEDNEYYTIQEKEDGHIHQVLAEDLLDHDPTTKPTNDPTLSPLPEFPWLENKAKATLYLSDKMQKPKQGYIINKGGTWIFTPGRKLKLENGIDLANDTDTLQSLINNKKLFKGWKTASVCLTARRVRATSNLIAELLISRKVSAKGLIDKEAPTSLLKHNLMHPQDRAIWDESYRQEYEGLVNIDTWETITEEEYQNMKHLYKGVMPTMAIAVIKHDGNGVPIRAKYRIVALGNLDPNHWEKSDCFAPVLSQLELRLLVSLAAKKKQIPKTGDITQAFCQSSLPPNENYICKPPVGCKLTPKGHYLKLKKTLYGLKRSPRHFYDLARKTLEAVGMRRHPTSPCLFIGNLIKGHPPIYLGLYVDDMIYFSESDEVERKFEQDFKSKLDTNFNDKIDYFLGINFTHRIHEDGNVTIKMGQTAFTENLIASVGLLEEAVNAPTTPYKSGFPADAIPYMNIPQTKQEAYTHQMRVLCGSLNWLAQSTRPDIATITNILSKYTATPNKLHIDYAKRVIKYLKGTKTLGISFSSKKYEKLESFVKFPLPESEITALADANWGPQDQSKPKENEKRRLDIFKSRSISGFLLWLGGPLHWVSKRQSITARSSAEAEIYATDECTKALLNIYYILEGMGLHKSLMAQTTTIYNDNSACVQWSRNTTTKGLRHIQIRENAVREAVQSQFIRLKHIEGKLNLSDMFTKEEKHADHFITIRDFVLTDTI